MSIFPSNLFGSTQTGSPPLITSTLGNSTNLVSQEVFAALPAARSSTFVLPSFTNIQPGNTQSTFQPFSLQPPVSTNNPIHLAQFVPLATPILATGQPAPQQAAPMPAVSTSMGSASSSLTSLLKMLLTQLLKEKSPSNRKSEKKSAEEPTEETAPSELSSEGTGGGKAPGSFPGSGKIMWDKAPAFIKKQRAAIEAASQKSGMPESLIAAMITNESSGNEGAITTNPDGELAKKGVEYAKDVGVMQVNGNTYMNEIAAKHSDLPKDIMARYKSDVNILAGAYYVADLPFDSWELKLRAYNSGAKSVLLSDPEDIKPNENGQKLGTLNYPSKILGYVKRLEEGTLNW